MIAYKIYCKDYRLKRGRLLGVLVERRNDLRGESQFKSALKWAISAFGDSVKANQSIVVVPAKMQETDADPRDIGKISGPSKSELSELDYLLEGNKHDEFCALLKKPFVFPSDPKYFYFTSSHRDALASTINGIYNQVGLISITGERGTGKTTIIHVLTKSLSGKVKTAVISQTSFTLTHLLKNILLELDVEAVNESENSVRNQLEKYLSHKLAGDETLAVIIDEAQDVPLEVLWEFGKLLELEKRLRVILVGLPELEEKLRTREFRRLCQRIGGIRRRIKALSHKESKRYIYQRLKLVGTSISSAFTPEAISIVIDYARGIPRTINILCDDAFAVSRGLGRKRVDADIIRQVIKDMEDGNLLEVLRQRSRVRFAGC
jgi:type II secretory pathway predicted ATPase ExeA